ncbi:glycosyltransferase family 2 protein [Fibrella forsythiae]|uniref:Glycosyltransferase n=1 Tax=Fibrella forsythiae TaxID=2817061 RepID=A0ABS3JIN8_9BACT|nr:glycosyltransferase family 2 protein [Fibrella forsythiae]MBO0948737.1 glycosyltransferase [Fibrella forsythiae]
MNPYFTVVIPTGNHSALLPNCLEAIAQQQLTRNQFEIVVVDDANNAETASLVHSFAHRHHIEIRYLAQPHPMGLAAARNRGWRAARGQYIAFTDDDCVPQPGWLLVAQRMFMRGAQVVTGTVRTTLPIRQAGARRVVNRIVESSDFLAANCFCQTGALQRAGGFEESFDLAWRVDADLQFKLLEIGIPILKCPEAVVVRSFRVANRYAVLTNERQNRYDALLYKRHPDLFRQRIPRDEVMVLRYYTTIISLAIVLVAAAVGYVPLLLTSAIIYVGLTAWLAVNRWPTGSESGTWEALKEDMLTAVAIPFLSVFWRLYGSVKYRVLYL